MSSGEQTSGLCGLCASALGTFNVEAQRILRDVEACNEVSQGVTGAIILSAGVQ